MVRWIDVSCPRRLRACWPVLPRRFLTAPAPVSKSTDALIPQAKDQAARARHQRMSAQRIKADFGLEALFGVRLQSYRSAFSAKRLSGGELCCNCKGRLLG